MRILKYFAPIILCLALLNLAVFADKEIPPLNERDIQGQWVGYSRDGAVWRIQLEKNHNGTIVYYDTMMELGTTRTERFRVYKIIEWTWNASESALSVRTRPVGPGVHEIYVKSIPGPRGIPTLEVEIGASSNNWKTAITLIREFEIQRGLNRTREFMEEANSKDITTGR